MSASNPPPKIACPHCQGLIKSPGLPPGSQVNCPKCGKGFRLEGGEPAGGGKAEVGRQKSEVGSRKSEVGGQPAARPAAAPVAKPGALKPAPATQPVVDPFADLGPAPSHKPVDQLVDPNLLAPPPPRKKPKTTHIAVVCSLCGSRLHAPLDKAGQTIQCPDCHTVNDIKPPQDKEANKPKGPTLEGVEEYELSTQVERPAYRPLQAPRGDYQILSELDPASHEQGWSSPTTRPAAAAAASTAAPTGTAAPVAAAEEDDDEFVISAPVERVELKPAPIKLPPPTPVDPEDALRDGRYDDELFGANVNRKAPGAWKLAPFRVGIVEFLFQPNTLMRWILYSMGAAFLVGLANFATSISSSEDVMNRFLLILCSMAFGLSGLVWCAPLAACCLAVVEDTANGTDEVTSWPDYNIMDWFFKAFYFLIAGVVAGFPGIAIGSLLVSSGAFPPPFLAIAVLASWVAFFPLVLCSMLAEGSMIALYSPQTIRSLKAASEAWMMFYLLSFLLWLIGAGAIALANVNMILISSVGAVALVALAFIYCRLLGRMMWVAQDKVSKLPVEEEG